MVELGNTGITGEVGLIENGEFGVMLDSEPETLPEGCDHIEYNGEHEAVCDPEELTKI